MWDLPECCFKTLFSPAAETLASKSNMPDSEWNMNVNDLLGIECSLIWFETLFHTDLYIIWSSHSDSQQNTNKTVCKVWFILWTLIYGMYRLSFFFFFLTDNKPCLSWFVVVSFTGLERPWRLQAKSSVTWMHVGVCEHAYSRSHIHRYRKDTEHVSISRIIWS